MPSPIKGKWNIKNLLEITAQVAQTRFEYMTRDVIKTPAKVRKIVSYDGKKPGESRTRFEIYSSSYPQYYPYYTKKDSRGRSRTYQRTYKHTYIVTIQMDQLTIESPIKIRTGSDKKYVFNISPSLLKSKTNPNGRFLSVGDYNIEMLGINPDHFFTQSWVRKQEDCLFGRNYANGPPLKTNPKLIPFLTKHEISVINNLMNYGVFSKK